MNRIKRGLCDIAQYIRYRVWVARHGLSQGGRIKTHVTSAEKMQLFALAQDVRQGNLVEIGSYMGASSYFLAAALKYVNSKAKVYCVDTWQNDAMTEGAQDTYQRFMRNTNSVQEYLIPLRGKSCDVAATFTNEIDLLFIDGDHSYEGVKQDVESWLSKVKVGGMIVFHDIGWAEGVNQVIQEFIVPKISQSWQLPNLYWAQLK